MELPLGQGGRCGKRSKASEMEPMRPVRLLSGGDAWRPDQAISRTSLARKARAKSARDSAVITKARSPAITVAS